MKDLIGVFILNLLIGQRKNRINF